MMLNPFRHAARAAAPKLIALSSALLLATACGDDGPNYPDVFDPAAIQTEITSANSAMSSPATEAFSGLGFLIDMALTDGSGDPLVITAPAELIAEARLAPRKATLTRLRAQATLLQANAIPAEALGVTFTYDVETQQYVPSDIPGAPANGVRFELYAVDPTDGLPVEPLVEVGHVDLTRSANADEANARVEVFQGTVTPTKVLDYSATVGGSVTTPRVTLEGFAQNATDRLDFSLITRYALADESIRLEWRTEVPTRDFSTRLIQTMSGDANPRFTIDAAVISTNGRIDIDGTVRDQTGGELVVRVNGDVFATMDLATGEDEEPVITNADGEPLTAEEEEILSQVFIWFAGAIFVFAALLGPVGPLLDAAF